MTPKGEIDYQQFIDGIKYHLEHACTVDLFSMEKVLQGIEYKLVITTEGEALDMHTVGTVKNGILSASTIRNIPNPTMR